MGCWEGGELIVYEVLTSLIAYDGIDGLFHSRRGIDKIECTLIEM